MATWTKIFSYWWRRKMFAWLDTLIYGYEPVQNQSLNDFPVQTFQARIKKQSGIKFLNLPTTKIFFVKIPWRTLGIKIFSHNIKHYKTWKFIILKKLKKNSFPGKRKFTEWATSAARFSKSSYQVQGRKKTFFFLDKKNR